MLGILYKFLILEDELNKKSLIFNSYKFCLNMKKLIPFFVGLICIAACTTNEKKQVPKVETDTPQKVKSIITDIEFYKGDVLERTDKAFYEKHYNENGVLVKEVQATVEFEYTYDNQGREISKTFGDKVIRSSYEKGKESLAFYSKDKLNYTITRSLNKDGKIVKEIDESLDKKIKTFKYDEKGNLTKLTEEVNGKKYDAEIYKYNNENQKIEVQYFDEIEALKLSEAYSYDSAGNESSKILLYPNGMKTQETSKYNDKGWLMETKTIKGDAAIPLYRKVYEYDETGRELKYSLYQGGKLRSIKINQYTFF